MKKATTRITLTFTTFTETVQPWKSEKLEKCIGFILNLYLSIEQ